MDCCEDGLTCNIMGPKHIGFCDKIGWNLMISYLIFISYNIVGSGWFVFILIQYFFQFNVHVFKFPKESSVEIVLALIVPIRVHVMKAIGYPSVVNVMKVSGASQISLQKFPLHPTGEVQAGMHLENASIEQVAIFLCKIFINMLPIITITIFYPIM